MACPPLFLATAEIKIVRAELQCSETWASCGQEGGIDVQSALAVVSDKADKTCWQRHSVINRPRKV